LALFRPLCRTVIPRTLAGHTPTLPQGRYVEVVGRSCSHGDRRGELGAWVEGTGNRRALLGVCGCARGVASAPTTPQAGPGGRQSRVVLGLEDAACGLLVAPGAGVAWRLGAGRAGQGAVAWRSRRRAAR
jgi:hypothetical protein